jgi:hypothetical protein
MPIDIPDDLRRRLEQLAKGPGQEVGALVCEAIEYRLVREERRPCWKRLGSPASPVLAHWGGPLARVSTPVSGE